MENWFLRTLAFSFKLWLSAVVFSDSRNCVWRPLRKPCRQSGTYELPLCSANISPHLPPPPLVVLPLWSWLCFPRSEGGYRAFLEKPPGCLYIAGSFASLGFGGLYNRLYWDNRRWETLTGCRVCLCNKKKFNFFFLGGSFNNTFVWGTTSI